MILKNNTMEKFNVLIYDFNHKKVEPYDIIPYFVNSYKECVKYSKKYKNRDELNYYKVPETFEDFKKFIKDKGMYQYWGRCEYEFIISSWPPSKDSKEKIDIYQQIMMNQDLIANIVMNECLKQ